MNIGYVYLSTYSYRRYMRQTQPIRRNVNGGILFVYTRGYLGLSLDIKYSLYPLLCSSSLLPALSQKSQQRNLVKTFVTLSLRARYQAIQPWSLRMISHQK